MGECDCGTEKALSLIEEISPEKVSSGRPLTYRLDECRLGYGPELVYGHEDWVLRAREGKDIYFEIGQQPSSTNSLVHAHLYLEWSP